MLPVCLGQLLSRTHGQVEREQVHVCTCMQVRRSDRRGKRERIAIILNAAVIGNKITPFSSANKKLETNYSTKPVIIMKSAKLNASV